MIVSYFPLFSKKITKKNIINNKLGVYPAILKYGNKLNWNIVAKKSIKTIKGYLNHIWFYETKRVKSYHSFDLVGIPWGQISDGLYFTFYNFQLKISYHYYLFQNNAQLLQFEMALNHFYLLT